MFFCRIYRFLNKTRIDITPQLQNKMSSMCNESTNSDTERKVIIEGLATISTAGNVFYNPVQEFNRDLSISVLTSFSKIYATERASHQRIKDDIKIDYNHLTSEFTSGNRYENGLCILEALSATGLRSIRYAREVPGVKSILANDISIRAVEDIRENISQNNVDHIVSASLGDATMMMHNHKKEQFDVIDLDPYGCPSIFLDGAVQAVKDGGLLLVTATDMAVLAGNSPETCYSKYGAVSLRMKSCHEMALRILLQCIETHANRYGRYIVPQLSISADFYVRVFVRVYSGAYKCKYTTSKLSMVYHCTGCDSFELQPLGVLKNNEKNGQVKFGLPTSPFATSFCEHCRHPFHLGGPIWSAPIHNPKFVSQVLLDAPQSLGTYKRIVGVLNVVLEELEDSPLYYTLEKLSGTLHAETLPMLSMRSAILNAGYLVSFTHTNKTSIKTDAPGKVVWDVMRSWVKSHPVAKKWHDQDKVTCNILAQEPSKKYSFELHPDANPESRRMGYTRFQENPTAHWGPGCRATAVTNEEKITKAQRNQGKRKHGDVQQPGNGMKSPSPTSNGAKEIKLVQT